MAEGTKADQGPKGAETVPFGAHLAEAKGKLVEDALEPLKSQLLSGAELDTLCNWLNANPTSSLAKEIKEGRFYCYGKPVGRNVLYLYWGGDRFGRFSHWLGGGWRSSGRAVLRG